MNGELPTVFKAYVAESCDQTQFVCSTAKTGFRTSTSEQHLHPVLVSFVDKPCMHSPGITVKFVTMFELGVTIKLYSVAPSPCFSVLQTVLWSPNRSNIF